MSWIGDGYPLLYSPGDHRGSLAAALTDLGHAFSSSASFGDSFINVKAAPYNAKGDGVTDDTAAIQAAFNALPAGFVGTAGARRVVFPYGVYRITSELLVSAKHFVQIESLGGASLLWDVNDSTQSMIRLGNGQTSRARVDGLWFSTTAGKRCKSALQFDGGGGNGEHIVYQCNVYGNLTLDFDYGLLSAGDDANNDHFKIIACHVDYVKRACAKFTQSQSKAHILIGNRFQSFSPHGAGVECGGSYHWFGGAMGSNGRADFVQTGISGADAIHIVGVNSEGSAALFGDAYWHAWESGETETAFYSVVRAANGRLYQAQASGTTGAAEPTHLAGTVSDGGVPWLHLGTSAAVAGLPADINALPIVFDSCRFSGYASVLQGIENLDGTNTIVKPDPSAAEVDNTLVTSTTVGWTAPITYRLGGPLHVRNCQFQLGDADPRIRRAKIVALGSIAGTHGIYEGNMISGSNPNVSFVYAPGSRVRAFGNRMIGTVADYGVVLSGFPEWITLPKMPALADSVAADVATLRADHNALLARLRTRGDLAT